jgi:uncharacterized protein (DUF58 family)
LIDVSASGSYGSLHASKRELAAEVACLLAFCAIRNSDKVGLILFTDRVELYIAPRKGRLHILRLIREILYYEPLGRRTDLKRPLDFLNRVTTRRAVVFLLSDFHAENYEKPLTICSRRHDLIAIPIEDRGELSLPKIGLVLVEDPETGAIYEINSSDRRVQSQFSEFAEKERLEREALFRRKSIDSVALRTDQDYFPVLRSFFIRRETRLRRR